MSYYDDQIAIYNSWECVAVGESFQPVSQNENIVLNVERFTHTRIFIIEYVECVFLYISKKMFICIVRFFAIVY